MLLLSVPLPHCYYTILCMHTYSYIYSYLYTRMSVHVCLSIKHGADIYRPLTSEETPPPRLRFTKLDTSGVLVATSQPELLPS